MYCIPRYKMPNVAGIDRLPAAQVRITVAVDGVTLNGVRNPEAPSSGAGSSENCRSDYRFRVWIACCIAFSAASIVASDSVGWV
ncbi:hypothetical protein SAMN06265347_10851 [Halobellus salinus]|nr:hypothetical protein SAMN06265347_10851 [Halobellus salinus]